MRIGLLDIEVSGIGRPASGRLADGASVRQAAWDKSTETIRVTPGSGIVTP